MLKIQGKTRMAEEPSHIKQLSLIHVCKIGLKVVTNEKKEAVGEVVTIMC
jgi:hypothetical protein